MSEKSVRSKKDENKTEPQSELFLKKTFQEIVPGILLTVVIALMAVIIGGRFPLIGGAVTAIVIGFLIKNFIGVKDIFEIGTDYTIKKLLKVAIVLLGFSLSFSTILDIGISSLLVVLVSVTLGLSLTYLVGRMFGLHGDLPLLIGIGISICGATAIATTSPILKAKEEDFIYAVNTIFAFNVLAVIIYPLIGQLVGMPDHIFGMWAGAAIHDTSSVVAAGYAYSDDAGTTAVVVKLLRTLMLIPVSLLLAFFVSYKARGQELEEDKVKVRNIFPYFILFFVAVVMLNTLISFPDIFTTSISELAKFIIIMVMASVGLKANYTKLKSIGPRPFIVGLLSSVIIGVISILLIFLIV